MIKLFISTYNRLPMLKESIKSLIDSFSVIKPCIIITDDGSSDPEVLKFLHSIDYDGHFTIHERDKNLGLPAGKLKTIETYILHRSPCISDPYFLISDSDIIYKKSWIEELVYLYHNTNFPTPIVTGFNTTTNGHETKQTTSHYHIKKSVGGCNLLVSTEFYRKHPFKNKKDPYQNWDFKMSEQVNKENKKIIASNPSVVDHIGKEGVWARKDYHDKSEDFYHEI